MSHLNPLSPGVGARRRAFPKLPLSAFNSPTTTTTGDGAPVPPSPSSVQPSSIVDAHVALAFVSDLRNHASAFGSKLGGIVIAVSVSDGLDTLLDQLKTGTNDVPIKSITIPLAPSSKASGEPPTAPYPISVLAPITKSTISEELETRIRWALNAGLPVELDVRAKDDSDGWEYIAELILAAQHGASKPTPIIISNVLPPHSSVDLPLVKLISHPGYITYQSHIANLSLVPNTYLKFVPPSWDTVGEGADGLLSDQQVKEWKRRVKMYLGPAVEAFGDARVIFGTSAAGSDSKTAIRPVDWFELARESIVEIGVEQEGVDAIFAGNALNVYDSKA